MKADRTIIIIIIIFFTLTDMFLSSIHMSNDRVRRWGESTHHVLKNQ